MNATTPEELAAQVTRDMEDLKEETELLLIHCCWFSHKDKQSVVQMLRAIRGQESEWKIDTGKKVMKSAKLTKLQQETLDTLKSGSGSLEIGPGLVQPRTAEALVRKGFCEYGVTPSWGDGKQYRVIRLVEENG